MNAKKKRPKMYQKKDGKWYCTLKGRQRYLGVSIRAADEKLETLLKNPSQTTADTIEKLVGGYLKSLEESASPLGPRLSWAPGPRPEKPKR